MCFFYSKVVLATQLYSLTQFDFHMRSTTVHILWHLPQKLTLLKIVRALPAEWAVVANNAQEGTPSILRMEGSSHAVFLALVTTLLTSVTPILASA